MKKKAAGNVLKLCIFLAIFGLVCYGVFSIAIVPKTPATVEQVMEVMTSFGYEPQDKTDTFIAKNPSAAQNLQQCIAIEKEDVHFEFYSFYNENSAIIMYREAYWHIYYTKMSFPNVELDTKMANYCKYTLKASGTYSVAMYVGPTAVYACSDEENADAIIEIMKAIGY